MAEPFLGEIRIFSFVFQPQGWALANGQFLPINQNQALFSLLGTTYGGNGQTTFALPDLRAKVPIHQGSGHTRGEKGGETAHTLSISEMPTHTHVVQATNNNGAVALNSGNFLGAFNNGYAQPANLTTLSPATVGPVGGSQPHVNMQPFLVLSFCIALQGIFPSQN